MASIPETLADAWQHYQAGRLLDAAQLYHAILQQYPEQIDALQVMGIIAAECDNYELAIAYFNKAVAVNPSIPALHANLGNLLREQGRYDEAINHYQNALTLNSNNAEIHNNLGLVLEKQGKLQAAIAHYQQAIDLQPSHAEFHSNLASALQRQNFQETIAQAQPALMPTNDLEAHINLGNALREQGQLDAAISQYQQALALEPNSPEIHYLIGFVLQLQEQLDLAIRYYQRVLALNPKYFNAYNNWGVALIDQGQLPAAIRCFEQALVLNPNYSGAHYNLGIALLKSGDFQRGFAEHEWRWQTQDTPPRPFTQPQWDGSKLEGKTILLYEEQGLGDQIQFIRYVPLVAEFGGRIVVECSPALMRLFKTVPGISQLVARGESLPQFDVHAPLMSLPWILGTTLETIPSINPYLFPDESIAFRLETPANRSLKVGIVWSGNPEFQRNAQRSCKLSDFLTLLNLPNIAWFSLQKGPQTAELAQLPQLEIQDLSLHLHDFADTAAAVSQLDLVITVDTAVAHLSGALGKPTWLLLSFSPDWRWLLQRLDSPWYPTMRLFRQAQPGNWAGVFEQVKQALTSDLDIRTSKNPEIHIS